MHPWHDVNVDSGSLSESVPVIIEIPRGSRNKYELDKKTGLLRLDRVLHGAIHYPANYGFIPRTLGDDADPLDILVLGLEPVHPLVLVEARPIGALRMKDEKGIDDKLIGVSRHDPAFFEYSHFSELPTFHMLEMEKFFEEYKTLENKEVLLEGLWGPDDALRLIREGLERYQQHFPEKIPSG